MREVNAATEAEYDASARDTIRQGRRFTYRDRGSGALRVGYYDRRTGRFTALDDSESRIIPTS